MTVITDLKPVTSKSVYSEHNMQIALFAGHRNLLHILVSSLLAAGLTVLSLGLWFVQQNWETYAEQTSRHDASLVQSSPTTYTYFMPPVFDGTPMILACVGLLSLVIALVMASAFSAGKIISNVALSVVLVTSVGLVVLYAASGFETKYATMREHISPVKVSMTRFGVLETEYTVVSDATVDGVRTRTIQTSIPPETTITVTETPASGGFTTVTVEAPEEMITQLGLN